MSCFPQRLKHAAAWLPCAALLGGCSAGLPSTPAPHAAGWGISSQAKAQDLLYLSDADGQNVYVFTYPTGKLVGELGGFGFPSGECVDAAGNVWISNVSPSEIIEYHHGGLTPLAALPDASVPYGCAVDPMTGDLAVANNDSNIAIYHHASGTPTTYRIAQSTVFRWCAYDANGNLFADDASTLFELRKSDTKLRTVKIDPEITPASIQWHDSYLAMVDYHDNSKIATIDHLKVSNYNGRVIGLTQLANAIDPAYGQYWIQSDRVVGATDSHLNAQQFDIWKYPQGGQPVRSVFNGGTEYVSLYGAVVSLKNAGSGQSSAGHPGT
jgi:hypothetical protein